MKIKFIKDGIEKHFCESIKSVKMNKQKYPVGRKLCTKTEIYKNDFNLVNSDDGGKDLKEYKYKIIRQDL